MLRGKATFPDRSDKNEQASKAPNLQVNPSLRSYGLVLIPKPRQHAKLCRLYWGVVLTTICFAIFRCGLLCHISLFLRYFFNYTFALVLRPVPHYQGASFVFCRHLRIVDFEFEPNSNHGRIFSFCFRLVLYLELFRNILEQFLSRFSFRLQFAYAGG